MFSQRLIDGWNRLLNVPVFIPKIMDASFEEFIMATLDTSLTERRHLPDRRAVSHFSALNAVDWLAMVLLIIGGINWGLIGLMNYDLVSALFGETTQASRIVYLIVGLAGLYAIYMTIKLASNRQQ
jgi:uncharacterized membrane protein YuzA (DUF378 family)